MSVNIINHFSLYQVAWLVAGENLWSIWFLFEMKYIDAHL